MAPSAEQMMTARFPVSRPLVGVGRRLERIALALAIAALLSGLWATYVAVNAGADYPEPWTQLSD